MKNKDLILADVSGILRRYVKCNISASEAVGDLTKLLTDFNSDSYTEGYIEGYKNGYKEGLYSGKDMAFNALRSAMADRRHAAEIKRSEGNR